MSAARAHDRQQSAKPPATGIPQSCLHEAFHTTDSWERSTGRRSAHLHLGEPCFGPIPEVVEATAAALRDGRTGYTGENGMPELRTALAAKLEARNGVHTDPDLVFATPGSCQALVALMQTLAAPGQEILLPEVHWPVHLQQALLAGLRPVFYPLDEHHRPDPVALAELGGPDCAVLLLNTPANPTGAVYDAALLGELLAVAQRRGWQVISDEAYEDFAFDGEHVSPAALERGLPPAERRVSSTFSFSKSYGMTGYRLGYAVVPNPGVARTLHAVQQATIVAPPTPVQWAGLAALDTVGVVERHHAIVRASRDTALPPLVDAGLLAELPAGGWSALLDLTPLGRDADGFADELLHEHGVSLAAGSGFTLRPRLSGDGQVLAAPAAEGSSGLLRLCFCGDPDALVAAVGTIVDVAGAGT